MGTTPLRSVVSGVSSREGRGCSVWAVLLLADGVADRWMDVGEQLKGGIVPQQHPTEIVIEHLLEFLRSRRDGVSGEER
jgi:hypothetical protein